MNGVPAISTYTYDFMLCATNNEQDAKTGRQLAGSIRRYRLPKSVDKNEVGLDYRRIFEDYTEAPLDDTMRALLDQCRFLVVLCTPRTRNNAAIAARLDYFAQTGRRDKIIAVLAEGDPIESFPAFFIETRTLRQTMPDGTVRETTETIEPVASDLRGQTKRDRRRLFAYETVRIVAALVGIHPNTLEQRHQKRRKQRLRMLALSVGSVSLVVAIIFTWLGLQALRQGRIAQQQTEIGADMVDRLFAQLPEAFANNPEAGAHVDAAILDGLDTLLANDSANAGLVQLETALDATDGDSATVTIRKAALWRRFGLADKARELYAEGISRSGLGQGHVDLFSQRTDLLLERDVSAGYLMYVLQNNGAAPLQAGDLLAALNGQSFGGYTTYSSLVADALPGTTVAVDVLRVNDQDTFALITLQIPPEDLDSLLVVAV